MGRMLVRAVGETAGARLSGATERPGHEWIGRDLGEALGGAPIGVIVEEDPLEVFARSQAVLDFTVPEATLAHAELAAQARLVHVIGTTGLERRAPREAGGGGAARGDRALGQHERRREPARRC